MRDSGWENTVAHYAWRGL